MTPSRLPRPSANLVQSSGTKGALVIHARSKFKRHCRQEICSTTP
jgi:hypothetical protein